MTAPLAGIRVLDLTRVLSGPFCTAMLADLGAEVVKLEPPAGDDYRHIGPFREGESALFQLVNRGKTSVVIDLKAPEGQRIARDLALSCDVVVENFRPGVAAKLGLGAEALRAEKPALVYASISGFGQSGPWAALPAYDIVVQALSGLMDATGEEGGAPLKAGESIADLLAGLYAVAAINAALVRRAATGEGATLDISMLDCLFAWLPTSHALGLIAGQPVARVGNRHPLSTPFGAFRASDGHVVIAVLGPRQWQNLCALIGRPDAAADPQLATDEGRTAHEPQVRAMIEDWSATRPAAEAVAALSAAGIPASVVATLAEAAASDHAAHRGLVARLDHPRLGPVPVVPQPVRFDGARPMTDRAAPAIGGGTRAVMAGLGLTPAQIDGLIAAGVIVEDAA